MALKSANHVDPSRTALIRRQFAAEVDRRLAVVVKAAAEWVKGPELVTNAPFVFELMANKLTKFRRWLTGQVTKGVLEADPVTGEPRGMKAWLYKYIGAAYRKGIVRAYNDTHSTDVSMPMGFTEGTRAGFLEGAFARPERRSKLELLYTRAYENLRGITSDMSVRLGRVLADGMAKGLHPTEIARNIKTAADIPRTRARMLARTETIHAHAEGQLDGMTDLGVTHVGAEVEYSTAGDSGVCPKCKALEGKIYTIQAARGVIPLHPNCRCTWLPVVPRRT